MHFRIHPAIYISFSLVLLWGLLIMVMQNSITIENQSALVPAISIDLVLSLPLIYLLLIRKTKIPKITVVPIMVLGMTLGLLLLPEEQQYFLLDFKTWVFPFVELGFIIFILWKVRRAIKVLRVEQRGQVDFYDALKSTCQQLLPGFAVMPVLNEIAVFYYGFFSWRKRKLTEGEYSYHRESGTVTLMLAILLIIGIETFVLHRLLLKWSEVIAWILSALSIYSGFQIFGFLKSMLRRPYQIRPEGLKLNYGIMNETFIPFSAIKDVEASTKELDFKQSIRRLSFLGSLESHNVIIYLKEEAVITGLYGKTNSFNILALHVDRKQEFVENLRGKIIESE